MLNRRCSEFRDHCIDYTGLSLFLENYLNNLWVIFLHHGIVLVIASKRQQSNIDNFDFIHTILILTSFRFVIKRT